MKFFLKNINESKSRLEKTLIILSVLVVVTILWFYNTRPYVIVRFDELGPLTKNMSAYYNGFKIGRISQIEPDKDFKHTLVTLNLNLKDLNLPQNTSVYVERFPNGELYLQFVYPQSPSLRRIKRGDMIEGIAPYNLEQFMMGQSISGMSDLVSIHIIKALNAADAANQEMNVFFKVTSKLIKENDKGIKESVNNTAIMTKNLAQMAVNLNQTSQNLSVSSKKLHDSLGTDRLDTAVVNLVQTTSNISELTENIAKATKDLDKTMKKVDETVANANSTAQNLNSMTSGLNDTMQKRFAGVRIMFGKPINPRDSASRIVKSP